MIGPIAEFWPERFSMAPVGGVFLAVVGATIIFGGLVPRFRSRSVWVGAPLGIAVAVLLSGRLLEPPPPTALQLWSLAIAVAAEVAAFVWLMPRFYRVGERAVVSGTLAIVGAHFALMLPAFGPPIALLALACLINAAATWRSPRYSLDLAWVVDGALKLVIGLAMAVGGIQ